MNEVLTEPDWHADVKIISKITLVVVDMQKLFLTEKKSPWMDEGLSSIIPNIEKLIKNSGIQNIIFTRFTPPKNWQKEQDSWQTYYRLNQKITPDVLGTDALNLIDDFIPYVPNSLVVSRKNRVIGAKESRITAVTVMAVRIRATFCSRL